MDRRGIIGVADVRRLTRGMVIDVNLIRVVIPANAGIQSVKLSLATHYKVSLRDVCSTGFPLARE